MKEQIDERLFVPCADGNHSQCMVQFRRADGSLKFTLRWQREEVIEVAS